MKKTGFAFLVVTLSSCLLGSGQLSVVSAQHPSMADAGMALNEPDLTNDPSVRQISLGDDLEAKSAALFQRHYNVGHSTRVLNVLGTRDETRHVNVHLWYPSRSSEHCNSGHPDTNSGTSHADSDVSGDDKGCPSVYTSRLHGIPLLPQWDALSWQIASTTSSENLPISGDRSFPVIIFSHGNQNNAVDYAYTLETLASFGFIVAAPDHVNNTQDDIRLDFINPLIAMAGFQKIPCFDGFSSPCEVSNRVKAENSGTDPALSNPCPQVTSIIPPVAPPTVSVRESMNDRARDVSAIIDVLPTWFGDRADISRVGVMGHSRGTVTALAAAGGSKTCWEFNADPRVKAIMGLAIGGKNVTFAADVQDVTVPALLVAGSLDRTAPASISQAAYNMLGSAEKAFVLIPNAEHRHFDSGLCAQTQSAGAIVGNAKPNAPVPVLDLQTISTLVNTDATPTSGVSMNFCGYETFTVPANIVSLVEKLSISKMYPNGFPFTSSPVPTDGLTSDAVKNQVVNLAVVFFGHVLERDGNDNRPFTDFLP